MKFIVTEAVFKKLEKVCFGVVVARGINNKVQHTEIAELLKTSIKSIEEKFAHTKVKEAKEILPYREAFQKLTMNPNKFMSSIEAMASRIEKKKGFPNINPIVDLGNAISLKYLVPLGAHDMDSTSGDIYVRFSEQGDKFIPFGQEEEEILEQGELIYSAGDKVKTRRWIWRQSEQGKVTAESKNIFFPIDGFIGQNDDRVIAARNELAAMLKQFFDCEVEVGFIDQGNREMEI
ncbi:B3/4 domain-containing protein [Desulforamulus aeronauticus]|uniref:B3/B4 domain-containing protein (DNA/RNA-binding domain of Phe-tRNA-synthetase) n=1 Tax=Desulforamulus aeronauticus DSM 10349 TaxID=1121421 RepID=A0A1M6TD85_9FIRM|nr:phenylalanine--tRNA ligase beta subunit-related protein [Desulforamulus aeronauticus]SHK54931.1 B3/B4 domain-containing protein (DNA/RNA-binding domain of Phe-tRNA-synthetase) [Desulforamulus aeronauticus DSM 10349]